MISILKSIWSRFSGKAGQETAIAADPVDYKGYRIRPAPYAAGRQYQTAGTIEKDFPSGIKEHRFIRAETHASKDEAVAFAIIKGKQIIDQQGDRLFGE